MNPFIPFERIPSLIFETIYSLLILLLDKELLVCQGCSIVLEHHVFVLVKHVYCYLLPLFLELTVLFLYLFFEFLIIDLLTWVKLVRQKFQICLLLFLSLKWYAKIVLIVMVAQRTKFLVNQRRVCQVMHWDWTAITGKCTLSGNDWNLGCCQFSHFALWNRCGVTTSLCEQNGWQLLSLHLSWINWYNGWFWGEIFFGNASNAKFITCKVL